MTKNTLLDAVTNLDADLIEKYFIIDKKLESQKQKLKKNSWLKWGSLAACFALVCVVAIALPMMLNVSADDFEIEDGVLLSYNGDDTEVEIPLSVTRIADYAFRDNNYAKNIETIVLTANVQSVGNYAFYGCENLSALSLTEDQAYFKNNAGMILSMDGTTLVYVNGTEGESLDIPASVTNIQSCAICYSNVRSLMIPESVTVLNDYSVIFNDRLESVVLNGVTEIGQNAFYNNISLKTISAPKATQIGKNAFSGCSSLRTIAFPMAQSVGENAFSNCASLEEVELPSAIQIADGAFSNCSKLFSVSLPLAESIGNNAFSESCLTMLYCPNVTSLGRNFLFYTKVTELTIPKVTSGLSSDVFNGSRVRYLCGNKDSYIEQYAVENGFTFIEINPVSYPDGYAEANDIVYVLGPGADLLNDENGNVVLSISPFSSNKTPLHRYAKGTNYSIVEYGGEQYYVKNESITATRPAVEDDIVPAYGDFEYIEYDTYIEITHYRGTSVDIVVPEQINGKPVLKLANAFLDGIASDTSMMRKVVKSITANSVTTLEEGMGFWRELYSLETLIMPKVEKIWDNQFQDATDLKYIDLSSATYIGDFAFNSMRGCETLILSQIEEISENAFVNATIITVKGKANIYAEEWARAKNAMFELIAE